MSNSMDGAKALRKSIERLAAELNSSEVIPDQGYRRNCGNYPYSCYVNNAFCLFYSKNYDMVPVFVSRAASHCQKYEAPKMFAAHREISKQLLMELTKYIDLYTESDLSHIQQCAHHFYSEYMDSKENA